MADNVIRQDIIQFEIDADLKDLMAMSKEIDDLKSDLTGGLGDDTFDDLKKDAKATRKEMGLMDNETDKVKSSFKGFKGISLTSLKNGLTKIKDKLVEIGKKAGSVAYTALKKIAGISFKALAVGIGGAATAIGGLVAKSTQAFADYEQLKGGVETLFKGSAGTVKNYANEAYLTAGISANKYMDTVTSFSASLISSCGGDTAKAAELANTAITDMSDNANKMGTDMDSLIQTYQSLAKGNFAMLDNLKLGYGGTKTELQRLIKDAAKYDKSVDANSMSYANIVKAIHAVQKEMDIMGTTQKEASTTVTGSLNSMKAAWGNLLTAIGSGENLDQCFDNMIKSAEVFGENLMPVVERALEGMGKVVEKLSPIIAEKLPSILSNCLPPLLKAAGTLIGALVKELPSIIKALIPAVKEAALEIVKALYEALTGKEMNADAFKNVEKTLDKLFSAMKIGVPVVLGLVGAFKLFNVVKTVGTWVSSFAKGIGTIAQKVSGGLAEKLPKVADGMGKTGKSAKTSSANMLAAAKSFMMIGAAVLMVAVGFGILAFSAISLANAGGAAIATMFGLVVALAALGFGMAVLLKSISSIGKKAIPAATAMIMLGAAVILIAAGFALLAFTAITLANAGGAAIAVFAGLVVAMALLAVGAALLGTALTAGAVGFIAFGAAIALVGVGFMLVGVGAVLAANALSIIAGILPQITQYGLMGALSITALGASLTIFALGAALAGASALILGAGLLVVAASLLVVTVSFALLTAIMLPLTALMLAFGVSLLAVSAMMLLISATSMLLSTSFLMLTMSMMLLTPLLLMFSVALLPLSATLLVLTPVIVLFTATVAALMAVFVILSPLAMLFSASMVAVAASMAMLAVATPIVKSALKGLPKTITGMIAPVGLLAVALAPLSKEFTKLAKASSTTSKAFAVIVVAITAASAGMMRFATVIQSVVGVVKVASTQMVTIFVQALQKMVMAAKSTNLMSAGSQMMNGLINGMNSRKAAAISTARSIAQAINKEYAKVQKIKSPSRVWDEFGGFQIQGDINGMKAKMPELKETVRDVGEMSMPYSDYTPENSTSYSSSRQSEYNSYSPQFNLTISGTNDDRAMERKVKRWITEAMRDMLDDLDAKTPQTQTV